jgi:hypothetical protein
LPAAYNSLIWRLSQNFSFWESNLRFRGKSGPLAAFSKAIPETNRVLGMARLSPVKKPRGKENPGANQKGKEE